MYISKNKLKIILFVLLLLIITFITFKYVHYKQTEKTSSPYIAAQNIIYGIQTTDKKIALTIEVNMATEDYTYQIADILEKNNIKATFFLTGEWIKNNNALAKKIVDFGHEIGNHSNTHRDISKMMTYKIVKEIFTTDEIIASIYNKECKYFRPPFSSVSKNIIKASNKTNKSIVMYSLESYDWKASNVESIINMVNTNAKPGDIISFHNDAQYAADALAELIPELRDKGYVFLTISELINN